MNPQIASPPGSTMAQPRLPIVDVARGVAIVAMFVYHFTWDLGFFGFIELQASVDPGWRWFAKGIASSFLVLVGVGLVLADRGGMNWRAYARRLALVTAAAATISLATWYATPDEFIFFGILHCIALSSVLALPFRRASAWLTAIVAAVVVALPNLAHFPALASPALLWLGLGDTVPRTNDYEPIFPWFGLVLAGVALARFGLAAGWDQRLASIRASGPVGRTLAFAGRHSLPLYLLHQPLFFGALSLLASATPPRPAVQPADFQTECRTSCRATGAAEALCVSACGCVEGKIRAAERAEISLSQAEIDRRMPGFVAACQRERIPDAPAGAAPKP